MREKAKTCLHDTKAFMQASINEVMASLDKTAVTSACGRLRSVVERFVEAGKGFIEWK